MSRKANADKADVPVPFKAVPAVDPKAIVCETPTVMIIAQTLSKSRKYDKASRHEEPYKSSHDTPPPIGVDASHSGSRPRLARSDSHAYTKKETVVARRRPDRSCRSTLDFPKHLMLHWLLGGIY